MTITPAELEELGLTLPPTQADLPYDDGEPMETSRHKLQMDLLIATLQPWLDDRPDGFVSGNMFVYYSLEQVKNRDYKGPDFFVVLGVPKGERLSWVSWEEGKTPDVVIELLSASTRRHDKTGKKQIYQDQMRVPEYFWYDPLNIEDWKGFRLQSGHYVEIHRDSQDQMWSEVLGLMLVRWHGTFYGVEATWLRWATPDGVLLPRYDELERQRADEKQRRADEAQQRADEEQRRADEAQQQTEEVRQQAESQIQRIVQNLLNTGLSLEQIAQITGLSLEQLDRLL